MAPQGAEIGALALGGNQGEPLMAFARALAAIHAAGVEVLAVSRAYRSAAQPLPGGVGVGVGVGAGLPDPHFWNIVCLVRPQGSPEAMLATCQALERAAGRRRGRRWGPRPLDIDLLFWGEARRSSASLTLPHPRLAMRPFVLWPLAELALDVPLPMASSMPPIPSPPTHRGAGPTPRQLLMAHSEPLAGILEVHRLWPAGTLDVSRRCG